MEPSIQKTLGYCKQIIADNPARANYLQVKGFAGHFYFAGIFIDRDIVQSTFKSQHEGIVLTFNSGSQ